MRTIKRDIVGAFIFSSDDKLLMGKGGIYEGCWIIPGGGIEPGETKLEALKREILEETGIDIDQAEVEQIDGALDGQSQKTLRTTGERVLVKMNFYNYKIRLAQPAAEVKLKAEDDFKHPTWFAVLELPDLPLAAPSITSLKKMGYL